MSNALGLNGADAGPVQSNSFNLTRVLASVSAFIALLTAGTSVGQALGTSESNPADIDWAGLTDFRRFVLLLFLLGAVTLTYSVDMISRSIVTSRVSAGNTVLLPEPRLARLKLAKADGQALAIRPSDNQILFYDPASSTVKWVAADKVDFRTP